MLSLGHNHWLTTNLIAGSDSNLSAPFTAEFNIDHVMEMSFNSAADYTATIIANNYNNLHLCLSGGLDSEYVAAVLCRNKIPFTPVIILTPNNAEIWYAFKFCKFNNLIPVVFDFSSKTGSANNVTELLIKAYQIAAAIKLPVTEALISNVVSKLLSDSSATVITGCGEPLRMSDHFDDPMGDVFEIWDRDCYLNLEYGDSHPGAFFTFTPEIFKAIITDIDCALNSQLAKSKLYGLSERAKSYSVFEYTKDIMGYQHRHINDLNKKFFREEHLKYVTYDRQQLLDML
jgi:hypothetical protein